MATVAETVTTNATEYLGYAPKTLTVNLAIEKFKDIRNYPSSYTEAMIETDMTNNISKITMAVVELDADGYYRVDNRKIIDGRIV